MRHPLLHLMTLVTLFSAAGASCPARREVTNPPPVVFDAPPTLPDIIAAVNNNGDRVRQLQAESATLEIKGYPSLQANIVVDRPRRFRLEAQLLGFTGTEVDLGSNDELFWLWIRRSPQPAVHFARHDQFAHSNARRMMPVEPTWLIEALGLVHLDPQAPHQGPFAHTDSSVSIRSRIPSAQGELTRVLAVHRQYGWIMEQQIYDAAGQLLASAVGSEHRFYPQHGVSLPQRVSVQFPPAQLAFDIHIGNYLVNYLHGNAARQWTMPDHAPQVNLAAPEFRGIATPPGLRAPSGLSPSGVSTPRGNAPGDWRATPVPATTRRPRYRGYFPR